MNWPAVQSWGYSLVVGKRTRKDFLLVDSAGQCWRLTDIRLLDQVNGPRRLLFAIAQLWRSPAVKVQPVLEPAACELDDVIREILGQIDRDDDLLTQSTEPDRLKQAVQRSQSAAELMAALKRLRAVEFHRLDEFNAG